MPAVGWGQTRRKWKLLVGLADDAGLYPEDPPPTPAACKALYEATMAQWGPRIKARVVQDDPECFAWVTNCSWSRLDFAAWTRRLGLAKKYLCCCPETDIDEDMAAEYLDGLGAATDD